MHAVQRFEQLLETYRRPDGSRWTGRKLDEATGGVVPRSYFTNLRKGRIENPGYEKMRAMALAMGFPPEEWFAEDVGAGGVPSPTREDRGVAGRVEHLFEVTVNPTTGEPYTNAEAARMSAGGLTEEDVEGLRTGAIADPTVSQVSALAGVFGVGPSYLLDRGEAVFDGELVEALRDEAVQEAAREISRLPERERGMVLGIVRHFSGQRTSGG